MRKANLPLIIGTMILLLILTVIIFPGMFTDKSPYNMQKMQFSTIDGKLEIDSAPYPPSGEYIMGSDDLGRDIYSLIIYGTRLTILLGLLIAIGRFLIALPMAVSAGFGNSTSKSLIRQFNILFSAIPALLISVIVLKLDFFTGLSKNWSIAAFVIVLSFVGWPRLGKLLMERVEDINKQPFIRGEIAIGKSRIRIAIDNVFPHLAAETTVLFFMEIARGLSMVMQMGIFSVFVGLLKIIKDTEGGVSFFDVSFEPEWAGMLASSRSFVTVAPWAILFPAAAFFISVLGFNLFGEGLRNILQRRDSMFVPRMRTLLGLNIRQLGSSYGKKVKVIALICACIIAVSAVAISLTSGNRYKVDMSGSGIENFGTVLAGTNSSLKTAELIAQKMECLGIKPLEDDFINGYDFISSCIVNESSLVIGGKSMKYGTDYVFEKAVNGVFSGTVYDATLDDLYNMNDFDNFEGKFVMIDKAYYNDSAINHYANEIMSRSGAKGILMVKREYDKMDAVLSSEGKGYPVILIDRQHAEKIRSNPEMVISTEIKVEPIGSQGMNVYGILEGDDAYYSDEAIIVGFGYNYRDYNEYEVLEFNLALMEEISRLESNSRSIIFMFLDGTLSERSNGLYALRDDFPYGASKVKVFINLTNLVSSNFDSLRFGVAQAPFTRQYAWSMAQQMETEFQRKNIAFEEPDSVNHGGEFYYIDGHSENVLFWDNGIASILLKTNETGTDSSIYEIGSVVLKTISNNNY